MNPNKTSFLKRKPARRDIRVNVVPGAINGIPDSMKTKLVYKDIQSVTAVAPLLNLVYRGNSVFDPDQTGTGHQPRYFDTYASLYTKYRVDKSKITIKAMNVSGTASVIFGIVPITILTYTTWPEYAELPRAKTADHLMAVAQRYGAELQYGASTSAILGLTNIQLQDDDYGASVTTNPSHQWFWNVVFSTVDSSDVSIMFEVTIEYDVIFYDRNTIGLS